MKIQNDLEYNKIDIEQVQSKYGKHLEYVNEFKVGDHVNAVYRNTFPHRKQGKDYLALGVDWRSGKHYATWLTAQAAARAAKTSGICCPNCGKFIFSKHRHDFRQCGCEAETFVDGGYDYTRFGSNQDNFGKVRLVTLSLLTGHIFSDRTVTELHQEQDE